MIDDVIDMVRATLKGKGCSDEEIDDVFKVMRGDILLLWRRRKENKKKKEKK